MHLTPQNILLIGSILLFISVWVSQGSYKFGVPALILFLGVGMLAGSEGVGTWFGHHQGIVFDNPKTAQFIGVVALNFILFSGGLDTKWRSIKPVLWQGVALSTVGVVLTAGAVGLFVYLALDDFSFAEAMLLGSIISSTDAAAVFSILRSSRLALKHNLKPMLELESGSNDPVAYLLTIMFISVVQNPADSLWKLLPVFIMQILIGVMAGYLMGRVSVWVINRIKTHSNGLYPVLMVALMFFTYSVADVLHGNGFLAIYIAAVYIGNKKIVQKELILGTFDGFAWLMQVVLFLSLGLLVHPTQVWSVLGIGLLISVFMIIVARPLSVFVTLAFNKLGFKNKLFVSWVGLRGAAPIVFATYPLIAGLDKAGMIFNIVFFISCTSMLIQGTSIPAVARWLKVSLVMPKHLLSRKELDQNMEVIEVKVPVDSKLIGSQLCQIVFPKGVRITMMARCGEYLIPNGQTQIYADDHLFVMCHEDDQPEIYRMLD